MTTKTFEYCSLSYLNQWFEHDHKYCQKLTSNDKETKSSALKNAGAFYKVARNLPLQYDQGIGYLRYEPVIDILDSIDLDDFTQDTTVSIKTHKTRYLRSTVKGMCSR